MNKQNTHTLNTQRKITLKRVSYYENKFKTTPSILPRSPFLWEKFPFSRIKEGRGWLIIHAQITCFSKILGSVAVSEAT